MVEDQVDRGLQVVVLPVVISIPTPPWMPAIIAAATRSASTSGRDLAG